jgi:hypothetical protein
MKKLLSILILATSLNIAHAQENLTTNEKPTQNAVELMLANPQTQNDTELVMFIMKSIEDKDIQGVDKKTNFVDTFKVSDSIKNQAKSYINQNINYSDYKKLSYGMFQFKKCNHSSKGVNGHLWDHIDNRGQCLSFPIYDCYE